MPKGKLGAEPPDSCCGGQHVLRFIGCDSLLQLVERGRHLCAHGFLVGRGL